MGFGHKTWDLEGVGQIDPPSVSWFSSTPAGIGLISLGISKGEFSARDCSGCSKLVFQKQMITGFS